METLQNINKILFKYKKKIFTQFFILENLLEFIKVLKILMNVLNLIHLEQRQYLSFV